MVIPDGDLGPLHSPEFPELGHLSYGLGFFVTTYRGHELAWHSGSIDGFSALMTLLPAREGRRDRPDEPLGQPPGARSA